MLKKSGGFLFIAIIILIFIVGFVGLAVFRMTTVRTEADTQKLYAEKAFYAAEAGVEAAMLQLVNITNQTDLETYCDNSYKATVTISNSQYRFRCKAYKSADATTETSVGSLVVPIDSSYVSAYAPFGKVLVGSEAVFYHAIAAGAANCGTGVSACMLVSTPSSGVEAHAAGTIVAQDQVYVEAEGAAPDFTNPLGSKTIGKAVAVTFPAGYENLWAVGENGGMWVKNKGSDEWVEVSPAAIDPSKTLNAAACAGVNDCYTVGEKAGASGGQIYWWNGTDWAGPYAVTDGLGNKNDLTSVTCSSGSQCWALDNLGNIYEGHATSWQWVHKNANPLQGIVCPTASQCVAVGSSGTISEWTGGGAGVWSSISSGDSTQLSGVACPSVTQCWAAGNAGTIISINPVAGTASKVTYSPSVSNNFVGIACGGTNFCLAVTDSKHEAAKYTPTGGWDKVSFAVPNKSVNGVTCVSDSLCFLAAENQNKNYALIPIWEGDVSGSGGVVQFKHDDVAKGSGESILSIGVEAVGAGAKTTITPLKWQEVVN